MTDEELNSAVERMKERSDKRALEPREWPPVDTEILAEWEYKNLHCLVCQGPFALVGYAAIRENNKWFKMYYQDAQTEIESEGDYCHGGITFSCYDLKGNRWFGWDAGHYGDSVSRGGLNWAGKRWTVELARKETEKLAEQLLRGQNV